jgi:hypothetical protein
MSSGMVTAPKATVANQNVVRRFMSNPTFTDANEVAN